MVQRTTGDPDEPSADIGDDRKSRLQRDIGCLPVGGPHEEIVEGGVGEAPVMLERRSVVTGRKQPRLRVVVAGDVASTGPAQRSRGRVVEPADAAPCRRTRGNAPGRTGTKRPEIDIFYTKLTQCEIGKDE